MPSSRPSLRARRRTSSFSNAIAGVTLVAVSTLSAQQVTPAKPAPPPPPVAKTAEPQKGGAPMTPAQARELFASVDEILSFASKDTGLPIQHTVKRALVSRDAVGTMLRKSFDEDKGNKRMERSELVLKKFGLLDRDFHLQQFLLSLLTEQIAGFYDDKTKTVNLLDWIAPDDQKPVLAHELTHALQDQKVDLIKWSDVSLLDVSKNSAEDNKHIATDEASTAREAVTEGQAMAVFVDWGMKDTGRTIADAPAIGPRLREAASDNNDSPILARAPLLLQQSLLFPYSEGLAFEQAILVGKGKQGGFAGVLDAPPGSSHEIMHPEDYIERLPVARLRLPDIHPLVDPEYTPYDVGVMGELDVRILSELFGGQEISDAITPMWKGGIYYAAQRKSATPAEKQTTASLALLYASRWQNSETARTFLHVYAEQMPRKYSGLQERKTDEASEDELVYTTREGDVVITVKGDMVFISEGFPLVLARQLRDQTLSVQSTGPMQEAAVPLLHDPALDLMHLMGAYGMPYAAIRQAGRYTQQR